MIVKRYQPHATWLSLALSLSACSDDTTDTPDAGDAAVTSSQDASTAVTTDTSYDTSGERSDDSTHDTGLDSTSANATSNVASSAESREPDAGFTSDATSPTFDVSDAATETNGDQTDVGATNTEERTDGDVTSDATEGDSQPTTEDAGNVDTEAAKALFWSSFTQQRVDDGAHVSDQLELALAANPADANLALLVAHSYLWRLSEFGRQTHPNPAQIPALAGGAEAGFGRAYALAPHDSRILGWLGSMMIGNGNAAGDETQRNAGHALIDQGVAEYPEFNAFVQSLVHSSSPVGSPEFDLALEAMWYNLDACAGFTFDREETNVREVLAPILEGEVAPACVNTLRASHNLEGFFLYFGDILLKANQASRARAMYDAARVSPTFELWPYRETLERRERDVEARLAAYANEDPSDDPALISEEPFNCAYCHAASLGEPLPASIDSVP